MSSTETRHAVITGAGSGMGRAMAINLAGQGARVAISDWDEVGLHKTAAMAQEAGAREVLATKLDVRDRDAVGAHADEVASLFGPVHLMVNNAGVALFANALEQRREDAEWIMDVDFWGVVNGTEAFLPRLIDSGNGERGPSRLVNISSLFGMVACPTQSAYNAAKFAVRGYSEALSMELRVAKQPVTVTTVHPGGIKTGIARAARYAPGTDAARLTSFFEEKLARMTADKAAAVILRGADRGRSRVVVGLDAKVLHLTQQVLGANYQRLVSRAAGRVLSQQAPERVAP
jgi:NAD(P)-dependent dehydrogenase (short-subunit alcohol dehydrogenase family)